MENRVCKNCKKDFEITSDELGMYDRLEMPTPKMCFKCREQMHFAFWVFGRFRHGTSALSGEKLITILPSNPQYPIYTSKEWYSDSWDSMDYGMEYDPKRSFFEQLKELQSKVPRPHQVGENNVNCDWCDDVWESKNCYLSRSMYKCEELLYGYRNINVKNSSDLTYSFDSEKCYDLTFSTGCFNVRHSSNSERCINGAFLFDCRNVQDSFMCWNLRNKQYCIRNEQYTKESYHAEMAKINLGSRKEIDKLKSEFETILREKATHRANFNIKTVDSIGNYLTNCKRCTNAFHLEESEDCYNTMRGLKNKSAIDITDSFNNELSGNTANTLQGYSIKYSSWTLRCRHSEYLDQCVDCENCFGCVGVRKKQYCILNKQYDKESYEKLREQIISDMKSYEVYGDFLPKSMSYSGYNASNAQQYFPKTKEEAISEGFSWEDVPDAVEGLSTDDMPDDIKEVKDDITKQAFVCAETGYRFKISPRELEFYRMMNIPLPRFHADYRNMKRFSIMTVIDAYPYECMYCKKEVMAYYPPEWGYRNIACEKCYQQEVM